MKKVLVGATWTSWFVWLLAAGYYGYQYALRLRAGIMLPQLAEAFELSTPGTPSLSANFYLGFCILSLVAGAVMDRFGARAIISAGALMAGTGAFLLGSHNGGAGAGRFLQGAGGVVALIGAVYIVATLFPRSRTATLIGVTPMLGLAGVWASQTIVSKMIGQGLTWNKFWMAMGLAGLFIAVTLFVFVPVKKTMDPDDPPRKTSGHGFGIVFRNPQSILCGLIASLLFIPITLDMIWRTQLLQEPRGLEYGTAVIRSAAFPLGWILGCPMWGILSDYIGRRKPLIVSGAVMLLLSLAWVFYGQSNTISVHVLGMVAGLASSASMLTYSVMKEANPPEWTGTATGVMNFLNITFGAFVIPVVGASMTPFAYHQRGLGVLMCGVFLAILLTFGLKETGPAALSDVSKMNP